MLSWLINISAFPIVVTVGCDHPPRNEILFDNKSVTENIRVSMLAKAAWLSAALTMTVMSKRTLHRAPPIAETVMYGEPGTSTMAGGVMFSFGHA